MPRRHHPLQRHQIVIEELHVRLRNGQAWRFRLVGSRRRREQVGRDEFDLRPRGLEVVEQQKRLELNLVDDLAARPSIQQHLDCARVPMLQQVPQRRPGGVAPRCDCVHVDAALLHVDTALAYQ